MARRVLLCARGADMTGGHVHHQHGPRRGAAQGQDSRGGSGDARYLSAALALIVVFMAAEVVVGLLASSLALLTALVVVLTGLGPGRPPTT